MVYVGGPVGYATGSSYVASDGNTHSVFDAQRRWLSETIRVNEAVSDYYEVFTTYGDNAPTTQTSLTAPVDE